MPTSATKRTSVGGDNNNPLRSAFDITPHNTNELPNETRAIQVTVAGNLELIFADDSAAVVVPVNANTLYPYQVKKVLATNTTATGIKGFY